MDLPRIELGALRLLSACDTTTPQTHPSFSSLPPILEKHLSAFPLINNQNLNHSQNK